MLVSASSNSLLRIVPLPSEPSSFFIIYRTKIAFYKNGVLSTTLDIPSGSSVIKLSGAGAVDTSGRLWVLASNAPLLGWVTNSTSGTLSFTTATAQLSPSSSSVSDCSSMAFRPAVGADPGTVIIGCAGAVVSILDSITSIGAAFNPSPDFVSTTSVGAGTYTAAKYHGPTDTVFLASNLGLGLACNATSLDILGLFFASDSSTSFGGTGLTAVWVDTSTSNQLGPAVFWGDPYMMYRTIYLNNNSLEVSAQVALTNTGGSLNDIIGNPSDTTEVYLASGTLQGTQDSFILASTKANCSGDTCTQCGTDPYCGFCMGSAECTSESSCDASFTDAWTQLVNPCLPSLSITPTTGALTGSTNVSVYGGTGRFDPSSISSLYCQWQPADGSGSAQVTPVTGASTTTAYCVTPAFNTANIAYNVTVYWATSSSSLSTGNLGTASNTFTPYDCSSSTCSTTQKCSDGGKTECGWCFTQKKCASSASCGSVTGLMWNNASCPLIASFSPASASIQSTATISVAVTNFPASSQTYNCRYGSNTKVAAIGTTDGSTNTITSFACPVPDFAVASTAAYSIQIVDGSGVSWTGTSANLSTFESYNCTGFSRCNLCTQSTHSECQWCSGSTAACHYTSAAACSTSAACPNITAVTPQSFLAPNQASQQISITAYNLDTVPSGTDVFCLFESKDGSSASVTTPTSYTYHTGSAPYTLTCSTPSSTSAFDIGFWDVSIQLGSNALMSGYLMEVYDCNNGLCTDCATALHTQCLWCSAPGANFGCQTSSGSSCTSAKQISLANATCPRVDSLSPNTFSLGESATVVLQGSFSILDSSDAAGLACGFASSSSTPQNASDPSPSFTGSVSSINSTAITCAITNTTTKGQLHAYLYDTTTSLFAAATSNATINNCAETNICEECVSTSGCVFCAGSCASSCDTEISQFSCPVITSIEPNYIEPQAGGQVIITGYGFLDVNANKRSVRRTAANALLVGYSYVCEWPQAQMSSSAANSSDTSIVCQAPTNWDYAPGQTMELNVLLNNVQYFDAASNLSTYTCTTSNTTCSSSCNSQEHCGWCVGAQQCYGALRCDDGLWLSSCLTSTPSTTVASLDGGSPLTFTFAAANNGTMPSNFNASDFGCFFGTTWSYSTSTRVHTDGTLASFSCTVPKSQQPFANDIDLAAGYRQSKMADTLTLSYVDCASTTSCSRCIATPNCGWCQSSPNACSLKIDCAKKWSNTSCPVNKVALGVGLGLGLFFLILLVLLIAFLVRRSLKKRGLVIQVREPDYDAIAWGSDVELHYRIPDDRYATLMAILNRPDFLLQTALSLNCPATEQDSLAKGLVFVACANNCAPQMIRTIIRAEVATCKEENTLFRSNSVASKMYKFYSRIVGIKYLYHCIARVILELEVLGKKQQDAVNKPAEAENEVSLLAVSMELDTEHDLADDVDTDTNLIQLQLICQKIMTVLVKTSLKNIPAPLREIFVEIDHSVSAKFPGSMDAIYKGLGGLFFLRFVCPAISAPHVYGLLTAPPNNTTQRQLVLITKVIQSIANMQEPGKKEQYMMVMSSFIATSIPRIIKFYDNLREAANINTHSDIYEREIRVPDEVLLNGLAATQAVLSHEAEKIKAWAPNSHLTHLESEDLITCVNDCMAAHNSAPKKLRSEGGAQKSSKKSKKSTK